MKTRSFVLLIGFISLFSFSLVNAAEPGPTLKPDLLLWDLDTLTDAREKSRANNPGPYRAPLSMLSADADMALMEGPFSVMQKTSTPPSGDKHDYVSVGIYWWPNPDTANKLPYIRKDGQVNPEVNTEMFDKTSLGKMSSSVQALGLAYYLTGQEKYAAHAAKILRTWFLDPATRMNPNLKFGQSVPGASEGRKEGIIETITFTNLLEATALLKGAPQWTENDMKELRKWFADFSKWLIENDIGKAEGIAKNNHGTWYDVQIVYYALFSGQTDLAKQVLQERTMKRIAAQITPEGQMPEETSRASSLHYSLYNLRGFATLAIMGRRVGVDLWNYQTADGRGIRKSFEYLFPYLEGNKVWPYNQLGTVDKAAAVLQLRHAAIVYQDKRYHVLADQLLLGKDGPLSRSNLIAPQSFNH
jgi:hypothetical protein